MREEDLGHRCLTSLPLATPPSSNGTKYQFTITSQVTYLNSVVMPDPADDEPSGDHDSANED